MAEASAELGGTERAAILLLSIGEDGAAEILRHMEPKEVQRLGAAMAGLAGVSTSQVERVFDDFLDKVEDHTSLGVDSEDYIRRVLVRALGEEKATALIERILIGGNAKGIESLRWMEPRMVADMICNEHPQVISLILCYLERDQAAEVLANLSSSTRTDALMRVATLDTVQPAALRELNDMLEAQVSGTSGGQSKALGGIKLAAEILNFVDTGVSAEMMEQIKEFDSDLGQQIEDNMFVFENLADVDDNGIQRLLREASSESVIVALKGADEAMREKFFGNMSRRAAEMMRDDLEAKGPVRLAEVEEAQKEIVGLARRLADEGQITLGGGDDFV